MAPRAVLMGPPGAGKTSVGEVLATLWNTTLHDTDADVERRAGKPVADIFVELGEPHFRELEHEAVVAGLAAHGGVLSLGGGAPLHPLSREALEAYRDAGGAIVFLDVSLSAVVPRVGLNTTRPLLLGNPRQQWLALMSARRPIYESLATVTVLTDDRDPADIARQIVEELA